MRSLKPYCIEALIQNVIICSRFFVVIRRKNNLAVMGIFPPIVLPE